MAKISLIDRASSIPVSARSRTPLVPTPRRATGVELDDAHLHLVPRVRRQPAAPTRIARLRRLLSERPFLVDAGFVGLTLGMAIVLWCCGW